MRTYARFIMMVCEAMPVDREPIGLDAVWKRPVSTHTSNGDLNGSFDEGHVDKVVGLREHVAEVASPLRAVRLRGIGREEPAWGS